MFANSSSLMAPAGGGRPFFGTNPIAWAAPRRDGPPVVADLSSSAVAWVRVNAAAQAGEAIPLGWALDADGRPTTDARAALAGSMVPAADHKGSALALLVDVMSGGVAGSNFSFEASGFTGNIGGPPDVGQVVLAIDPTATMGDGFVDRIEVAAAGAGGRARRSPPRRPPAAAPARRAGRRRRGARRLDGRPGCLRDARFAGSSHRLTAHLLHALGARKPSSSTRSARLSMVPTSPANVHSATTSRIASSSRPARLARSTTSAGTCP